VYRRNLLASALAGALAAPRPTRAQTKRVLRFVPQADLALTDPVQTTGLVTRNHGMLVFDTLYGVDLDQVARPQMAEGHAVEEDGRLWRIRLRDGLRFHDGAPVLARDCVASLQRWGKRDNFGLALMAATESVTAPDDRTIVFRLTRPFPMLPDALAKIGPNLMAVMPERLARLDPMAPVPEVIGSGPYRFINSERVPGALVVYERFAEYAPRTEGVSSLTAGPRLAHFDRVEWRTMPDAATAAAALQSGEVDWWEQPLPDLLPMLRRNRAIKVEILDTAGQLCMLKPNHLHPPFNNPAIRRALLGAFVQADFMQAVAGSDHTLWKDGAGFFTPGSPMASDAGLDLLPKTADFDKVRRDLAAAGYRGERVVLLVPTDLPHLNAMSELAADVMRRVGMNVDYQALDWGTVLQRLASQEPLDRGGWSAFANTTAGVGAANPAAHNHLRGSGRSATFGWFDSPRIEELRAAWFDAPDLQAQQRICRDIQAQAFHDVPFWPLGAYYQPTAYRADLAGMMPGAPLFTGLHRG